MPEGAWATANPATANPATANLATANPATANLAYCAFETLLRTHTEADLRSSIVLPRT